MRLIVKGGHGQKQRVSAPAIINSNLCSCQASLTRSFPGPSQAVSSHPPLRWVNVTILIFTPGDMQQEHNFPKAPSKPPQPGG